MRSNGNAGGHLHGQALLSQELYAYGATGVTLELVQSKHDQI